MIVTINWLLILLVFCEGRHRDADIMLPNERTTLDDCTTRFHQLVPSYSAAPAAGTLALIKEFAHMGAIGWTQPDGTVLWHCGGTLIWLDYIITAAHCVVDHRDVRPDIVRFGDLNLENDYDDEYAQQLKITEIHRHPLHRLRAKYHDIALMKLERPVRLHDTVCPACLWISPEIRFTELVATGWGSTGYFEDRTPALLKVSLKPMDIEQCKQFYTNEYVRGLVSGLHENHLCAFDEKMDTCEGDSGGPLQIKLLHHHRLTPFIVAITSFGLPCGSSKPGVYTKISPYKDWIVATMQKSGAMIDDNVFNATFCALRYERFREDLYSSAFNQSHVRVYRQHDHIYEAEPPSYIVKLIWNGSDGPHHCYGVIVDENTVLTVADCTHSGGVPVSYASHPEGMIKVSKIHVHPKYSPGSGYNNVAILRLEKLLSFIKIRPACVYYNNYSSKDPDTVFGVGRRDIYDCKQFPECIDPSLVSLQVYVKLQNTTSCLIPREFKALIPNGITSELICAGTDHFLVPGACELKIGSSISLVNKVYTTFLLLPEGTQAIEGDVYPPLDGLVQIGRDCGYGEHLVATRLRSHLEWMERILLPKTAGADTVQFLDPNRHDGDSCNDEYGLPGHCVSIARCQRMWKKYGNTRLVNFCSSSSVICCPNDEIDKEDRNSKHTMLEKCPKLVKVLLPEHLSGPMVRILDNSSHYICMGAIVTDGTILTSASCIGSSTSITVQPIGDKLKTIFQVEKIIKHYAYNSTDYSNDIALLRLTQLLNWSPRLHPFCLWTNRTHAPLIVEMMHPIEAADITYSEVLTMYNSDCQRTHVHRLRDSHICVKYPYQKFTCLPTHSILRWEDSDGVPYIVGLSTETRECESWYYMTFSRTSAFVNWIVDNIDEAEVTRSFKIR